MSAMHTIDQLIEELRAAREVLGGDAEVRVVYQRAWPVRLGITGVRAPEPPSAQVGGFRQWATGTEGDGAFCWLTAERPDVSAVRENPYGPGWAWS